MTRLLLVALPVSAGIVGDDETAAALVVAEEPEDALLFHQARHEVERRFLVLQAVLAPGVGAAQREFVVGKPVIVEHFLDDLRERLVGEGAAARRRVKTQTHGTTAAR